MGLTACTEPQCLYKGALYLFTEVKIEGTGTAATQVRLDVHRDQLLVFPLVCADSLIGCYLCVCQARNRFTFEHLLVHLE